MQPQILITEREDGLSIVTGERPRRILSTDDVRAGTCSKVVNQLAHKGWSTCIIGSEDECDGCILNKN